MKKLLIVILLCTIATPFFAYQWTEHYFQTEIHFTELTKDKLIIIPKGAGVNQIADLLAKKGIIKYPQVFKLYIRFFKDDTSIKAGEYLFHDIISPNEVYDIITSGKVFLHIVTFPEGITVYQIQEILNAEEKLTGKITRSMSEGYYMPESYHFARGDSRESILKMMEENMTKFLNEQWEKRDKTIPLKTPQEALILASIVEKETGLASERGRIAAVFTNRLRKGMRLQSDPTTIYGITLGKGKLERQLLYKDLREKTAYNTYRINGLPPTPIANPSREAIIAVLNPPKSDELYFVADGTGGHVFAKTMKEHERNVQQWRKIQKRMKTR